MPLRYVFIAAALAACATSDTPPDALPLHAVSAGNGFTCGLKTDSTAWCWGANQYGQLGVDSTPETCKIDPVATGQCSVHPIAVSGGLRFAAIDAGESHACALTTDGRAYCWGDNASGQLGSADSSQVCSVEYYAQRGFGPTPCARAPRAVATRARFASLSAASGFTCGLTTAGSATCWGRWTNQRLGGSGDSISTTVSTQSFTQISADGGRACALDAQGRVWCWGANSATPALLPSEIRFVSLSRGWRHTCGISTDSAAYCWGDNDSGQLGNGVANPAVNTGDTAIHRVAGDHRFREIDAGFVSTCAAATDGTQYCWGDGAVVGAPVTDQCTHAQTFTSCALRPVRTSLRGVVAMTSGFMHRCALTGGGATYCWGRSASDSQRVERPAVLR